MTAVYAPNVHIVYAARQTPLANATAPDLLQELRSTLGSKTGIFNEIAALPDSFQLARVEYRVMSPETRIHIQQDFKERKPEFLKHIAKNHAADLIRMGVTEEEIRAMAQTGLYPVDAQGQHLACNIDHNISRGLGGTNENGNLSLIPSWVNTLKSTLENHQRAIYNPSKLIITFTTKRTESGFTPVPYVPGGYKPRVYL